MAAAVPGIHSRRKLVQAGRRTWTHEEDDTLLSCLKELVATGWKSDNGFRAGYVNKLDEMMRGHFPRANIRATPHITSKLTGWKKNYGTLAYILSRSGVGFNLHGDFTVDCDNEMWDQICSVDANAKNIRGKSWPYFDHWIEVFGKDRATGEAAEDVMDAVNELMYEEPHHDEVNLAGDNFNIKFSDIDDIPDTPEADLSSVSSRGDTGVSKGSRKRKATDDIDKNLCDLLGEMQKDTNSRLETISFRIGYQTNLGQARKEVFVMLEALGEFSLDEQFDVADVLLDQPQRLEFFTSLPFAKHPAYARRVLFMKGL